MKADVLKWIHETIRNPEDGKPFLLYPAQVRFIARAERAERPQPLSS
jgi:hypothetical protein